MAAVAEDLAQLLKDTIPQSPDGAATGAKLGRLGLPMGPAVRAYLLWTRFLRQAAEAPQWPTYNHLTLSAGHLTLSAGHASTLRRPGHPCGRADRAGAGSADSGVQAAVIVLPVTTG
jgi:hypothetical protein